MPGFSQFSAAGGEVIVFAFNRPVGFLELDIHGFAERAHMRKGTHLILIGCRGF
ncbi:hypothetical protein D9M73_157970 [compost metagenome]